jgi:hypothetical protein
VAQAVHDGRDDETRQVVGHGSAQHEGRALPPVHVPGHAVALEQIGELVGDALGPAAAKGLVDQGDGEVLAVPIGHHAGEPRGPRVLVGRLPGTGLAQERLGQLDGAVGEGLVAHPVLAPSVRVP